MNAKGYYEELVEETAPARIRAIKFELNRAEGPSAECGPAEPVTTWMDADNILRKWSLTAPEFGGYDKCDFTITYADGETYTGRYDLKRHDIGFPELLARHIRGFVEFCAGLHCPSHMTTEQYREYLSDNNSTAEYQDFLNRYEIGGELPAVVPAYIPTPKPEPKGPNFVHPVPAGLDRPSVQLREIGNGWSSDRYNVDIWPKQAIRLFGTYKNRTTPVEFDITFKLGDTAEYDSYNLSYTGKIVSIGPKTVTIDASGTGDRTKRLDIVEFAWRNWDFDAERIAKENAIESMCI